jgi:PAS domain S-box-containing protein
MELARHEQLEGASVDRKRPENGVEEARIDAERRAREAEEAKTILQTIFDHVPEGIVLMGGPPDFPILANSRHGQELLNKPLDTGVGAVCGQHGEPYGLLLPDGKTPPSPEQLPLYRAARLGERVRNVELLIERADGNHIPVLVDAVPIRNNKGEIVGAVNCWRDITERKRNEEALRAMQQQLQIVTEAMSAPVARCSRDLTYLWVNKPYADWLGRPPDQIIGRPIVDIIGQAAFDSLRPHFERVLTGQTVKYEEEVEFRGPGRRWVNAVYTPTFDPTGVPDGWVAVVIDIDDRKRAEQALKEADRKKDEFLAILAHELRNPLAPIRNAVHILRMRCPDDAELQRSRDIIDRQVQQVSRLVDDLLEVSRISQGKLQLRKERVELARVVQSALETTHPLMEVLAHELVVRLPPDPIWLDADPTRLAQVLSNLLNNAAKYTERGGHIWLTADRRDHEVVVSVRDTGIGIAAEHLPHIFEMFSQVLPVLERSAGGLGIGLSLVRGLVELHGGRVEASSAGPGKGSKFMVHLPIAEDSTRAAPEADRGAKESRSKSRARVLVVDDNRDSAESLATMLQLMGHDVCTAHDGLEALQAGAAFLPQVVLLDIGMPKMNGYDAARHIRQQPWATQIVLVALTGWGQEEDKRRALDAGFDLHLTKPVAPEVLQRLLALP